MFPSYGKLVQPADGKTNCTQKSKVGKIATTAVTMSMKSDTTTKIVILVNFFGNISQILWLNTPSLSSSFYLFFV
jgi:hypothetical protein